MDTLKLILREAAKINGTKDEVTNRPLIILLASIVVGPNIKRISKLTRIPRAEISWRANNLRKNRIWVGGKIHSDYFEKKGLGTINLLLDANVSQGYLERSKAV